jgi:hypothetical protein
MTVFDGTQDELLAEFRRCLQRKNPGQSALFLA